MKSVIDFAFQQTEDTTKNMIKRSPSSRLLNGIKCKVCNDCSSGKHYGIYSCDGCAGFFKRSIRRARNYVCKGKQGAQGQCLMDKTHRNHCRHCRLKKCEEAGMNKDAVQHERGPRNSTRQRHAAMAASRDLWGNRPMSPSMFSARFPLPSPEAAGYFACRPIQLREPLVPFATPLSPTLTHSLAHMRLMRMNSSTPILQPMPQYHPQVAFASTSAAVNSPPRTEPEASAAELAARVMLLNREWLKGIHEFSSLPMADQDILIEEATTELFLLTAAQYNLPATNEFLREAAGLNDETRASPDRESAIQNIIVNYQRIISQIRELNLDAYEYHYLKLTALFKKDTPGISPPRIKDLKEAGPIAAVHDQVQVLLLRHFELYYPNQHLRVVRLQQIPTCIRAITGVEIRKLFFSKTVGLADIEKIFLQVVRYP